MNQQLQYIPIYAPADAQAGGITCDAINMGKLHSVTLLFILGVLTGDGATFQFYAGAAASTGSGGTEIFPKYAWTGADIGGASADIFGARATTPAGGILLTSATSYDLRVCKVEIQSDQMPEGLPWLAVQLEDGSASAEFIAVIAVAEPRYQGDTVTTAL